MRTIALILTTGLLLTAGAACVRTVPPPKEAVEPPGFDSIPFRTGWTASGMAVLKKGRYIEPAAPGSASEVVITLSDKRAKGIVDGRDTVVAVLVSSGGGSGTFYDLVLIIKGPDGWKHRDTAFLGDRVKVHAVTLAGREVAVDLTEQGPDDPMCCPTHRRTKRYRVQDGLLKVR
jgi:hypothetical protein